MCLLVVAWQAHPCFRLVVAANRDEFHDRRAAPMAEWPSAHGIIAGRDLRANGTWLGIDAKGRFGVITNFRDLQRPRDGAPSRGALIPAYLEQDVRPRAFFETLAPGASDYSGFNLLLADASELVYASNRNEPFSSVLAPGVYGLSNHLLDTPWPKLVRVRERFEQLLSLEDAPVEPLTASLFAMLADREPAPRNPDAPPDIFPPELDRALSAPFVLHPTYGTRCSTVVLQAGDGKTRIAERSFDADGNVVAEVAF